MKVWQWLAVSIAALLSLTACGGGDSGGSAAGGGPDVEPPVLLNVSGQVADGYLAGAKVCLDVNENKQCEAGEPFALTMGKLLSEVDRFGQFIIEVDPTLYPDPGKFPLFVEVPADALDQDTGGEVGKGFTLSAPAGRPDFISPITTLVQQQLEKNPVLTTEEAERTVKTQIGVSDQVSLFQDYVKEKENEAAPAREEFARVHMVAQVVARTMGDLQTEVNAAAAAANIDLEQNRDAIVKLVVEEVMNRLQTIITKVEEAAEAQTGAAPFNPDEVATTVKTETTSTVSSDTIGSKIDEQKAVIVKSSFEKMLEGEGTFWLDSRFDGPQVLFEYGNVKLVDGQPVENPQKWDGSAWVPSVDEQADWILKDGAWTTYSDRASSFTIVFNVDGSALLTQKDSGHQEILRAVEIDLSGKPHSLVAGEHLELLLNAAAVFPAGTKGYQLTFMPLQDMYSLYSWTDDQGQDQNSIRYWNGSAEQAVASLEELKQAFAKDSGNYVEIEWTEQGVSLAGQFGSNGVLYLFERSYDFSQPVRLLAKTGSWSQVTVQGVAMIKVAIPDVYRANYGMREIPFFVVRDGKARRGEYSPANVAEADSEFNVNKIGFDSLLANLNFDYVPTDTGSVGGDGTGGTGGTDGGGYPDPGKQPVPLTGGSVADLQQVLGQGVTWFEFDQYLDQGMPVVEIGYGTVSVASGHLSEERSLWDPVSAGWTADAASEMTYALQADGWNLVDDSPASCTISFAAETTIDCPSGAETLSATEFDIAGLAIDGVVALPPERIAQDAPVFPAGAKAYQFQFEQLADAYEVEDSDWTIVSTYGLNGVKAPIGSFGDLASAFPAGPDSFSAIWIENGLQVQFAAGNALVFLQDGGPTGPQHVLPVQGSWEAVTVNGETLRMLNIPAEYREQFLIDYQPFLAEWGDGTVRKGEFIAAGTVEVDFDYSLNPIANKLFLANLILP